LNNPQFPTTAHAARAIVLRSLSTMCTLILPFIGLACSRVHSGSDSPKVADFIVPDASQFDADLGIAQSRLEEGAPFLLLTLTNKTDRYIAIPYTWTDPQLDNVEISCDGIEVGSLSPFPPPNIDLEPSLVLPPKRKTTLLLEFPRNSEFGVRSHHGHVAVKWIHHPKAVCDFLVSTEGKIDWPEE
jgi:hypothetical protein